MTRKSLIKPYTWLMITIGAGVCSYSIYCLPLKEIGFRFVFLGLITVLIGSRLTTKIPHLNSHITVSDTLVFLTMLLYGGPAAILVSTAEGLSSSLRVNKKPSSTAFNGAVLACSTFLTVWTLRLSTGGIVDLPQGGYTAHFIVALCIMALAQYVFNSGLVAVLAALKIDQPIWRTWKKFYLWTSITYFAGASAAGIISMLIASVGFYALIVTTPIIAIIYLTYQTYGKNIEATAAQAGHIEELSRYIAERKEVEEERDRSLAREQEARAEAETANRTKDEFLATLSHELRTPLTSIVGWAGLLRTGELSPPTQAQALEAIERNAKAQSQLIDDLLDVSRIISGKLRLEARQVDLVPVIEASIDIVRPGADARQISIAYSSDLTIALVSGDAGRLQQVVWNLLSNAVKFTPRGGQIEIRLEQVASHANIVVADTGNGINPNFLPFVFDRFRQANSHLTREQAGLGLGLAIVRHLVELHGGTVGADSEGEGRGSTFSVSLPIVAVRMEPKEGNQPSRWSQSRSNGLPTLRGLRVLIVDDADDARQMISAVLTQSGAQVKTAASACEALQALEQWRPDVLMSDIGMPHEDGYSLIQRIRALTKERGGQIPAAAVTAYAAEVDRKRALEAGYQMHVAKPVDPKKLVITVANLARLS